MALLRRAVALAALASAENLKTVYVATLPELVEAMEEPEVGRIFLNDSITLAGSPLPTIDGRLLAASCGRDDFREILGGKTMGNRHRHAW